jgi:hypothetical protein
MSTFTILNTLIIEGEKKEKKKRANALSWTGVRSEKSYQLFSTVFQIWSTRQQPPYLTCTTHGAGPMERYEKTRKNLWLFLADYTSVEEWNLFSQQNLQW